MNNYTFELSRKNLSRFLMVVFFAGLFGCSSTPKVRDSSSGINTIDLDPSAEMPSDIEEQILQPEEPAATVQANLNTGLFLSPGLFRSFKMLATLGVIEKEQGLPSVLSGLEWGLITALYIGKNGDLELAEWEMFDLAKKLKNIAPNSKEWKTILKEKLEADFKEIRLEDLKIKVLLPVWDKKSGILYYARGKVLTFIDSLVESNALHCEKYCPAYLKNKMDLRGLRSLKAGPWILINYLTPPLFSKMQGYDIGVMNIAESNLNRQLSIFDMVYQDSKDKLFLDQEESIQNNISRGESLGKDFYNKYRSRFMINKSETNEN